MRRTTTLRLLTAGIALTLVASACSDDSDPEAATPDTEAVADTDETTPTTAAGEVATGEPIVIGFMNNEGGAFSVPELRVGSEVAEEHINSQLGGVNGRPIQVERCATD